MFHSSLDGLLVIDPASVYTSHVDVGAFVVLRARPEPKQKAKAKAKAEAIART
tara:strand:- start:5141 stop:5299 length:159 start_codon:yes stop_codon:yes gene_type:complete